MNTEITSIVISSVSTLATVAAVFVAIRANIQAKEQLRKSIEIQEKANNTTLLSERLNIIEKVATRTADNDVERIKLLFRNNSLITDCYKEFKMLQDDFNEYEQNCDLIDNIVDAHHRNERYKNFTTSDLERLQYHNIIVGARLKDKEEQYIELQKKLINNMESFITNSIN